MRKMMTVKNGVVTGFSDEIHATSLTLATLNKTRVSHVVPKNRMMRLAFVLLRAIVSDESWLASWTRLWKGPWLVRIDAQTYGPFVTRASAIAFEKNQIVSMGKF